MYLLWVVFFCVGSQLFFIPFVFSVVIDGIFFVVPVNVFPKYLFTRGHQN